MIDLLVQRLVDELNAYVSLRAPALAAERVVASSLFDTQGQPKASGRVVVCTVNLEENRVYRSLETHHTRANGVHERIKPKIRLNVYLLFIANFDKYDEALKAISQVIAFFQQHGVSEISENGDERSRVVFELYSLTFEQQNHLWAALGAKYMPSVLYRASILDIRDRQIEGEIAPVQEIVAES